jgi:hypothetical protein
MVFGFVIAFVTPWMPRFGMAGVFVLGAGLLAVIATLAIQLIASIF